MASRWDFVVVPKQQILYRHSSQSMSAKVELMEEAYLAVLNKALKTTPTELHYLKYKSMANTYKYLTGLHLANISDRQDVRQAAKKLWKAICYSPQILLERTTQYYLLKLAIVQLLSPKITKYLTRIAKSAIKLFYSAVKTSDPRVQSS